MSLTKERKLIIYIYIYNYIYAWKKELETFRWICGGFRLRRRSLRRLSRRSLSFCYTSKAKDEAADGSSTPEKDQNRRR
jgi:hypothetical protein